MAIVIRNLASQARSFCSALIVAAPVVIAFNIVPANANGIVGQILLVAGECPAGYLPADGRVINADEYPELAAVLNEPTEVRFAQIDPVFAGDISPEPTNPDDPSADPLPNPIEQVLFKTIDGAGNTF